MDTRTPYFGSQLYKAIRKKANRISRQLRNISAIAEFKLLSKSSCIIRKFPLFIIINLQKWNIYLTYVHAQT